MLGDDISEMCAIISRDGTEKGMNEMRKYRYFVDAPTVATYRRRDQVADGLTD